MSVASIVTTALLALAAQGSATLLRTPHANTSAPALMAPEHGSGGADAKVMHLAQRQFMEVKLGPFPNAAEACDYCFGSFTKQGQPPAGPVAEACVCMAYPEDAAYNMFCATPVSAAGFVAEKGGCRCKPRDMEHMAATTCTPIQ
mmetsp:Transcript_43343/g.114152  ORF Transcript_43343/g.114152 Transcript_43343/m.114152 type:complete len:145 (-) Transcript_43343:55-489(-)